MPRGLTELLKLGGKYLVTCSVTLPLGIERFFVDEIRGIRDRWM